MARLKKTSVYLTQREHAALQRAAHVTRRSQSDLIREGVRKVAFSVQPRSGPSPYGSPSHPHPTDFEIRTRVRSMLDSHVATMHQLGSPVGSIARELGISESEVRQIFAKLGIPDEVRYG